MVSQQTDSREYYWGWGWGGELVIDGYCIGW